MDRVEPEPLRLDCPLFAGELVGCETLEGFEPATKVVGGNEVVEVAPELRMAAVVVALNGGLFDGPVHPLDLTVGPRVIGLGQPMLDAIAAAGSVEGVSA